jgi:hypothetical protein
VVNPGALVNCANAAKPEEVEDHPLKSRSGRMFRRDRRIGPPFGSDGHDVQIVPIYGGQVHAIGLAPQSDQRPCAGFKVGESIIPSRFVNVDAAPSWRRQS